MLRGPIFVATWRALAPLVTPKLQTRWSALVHTRKAPGCKSARARAGAEEAFWVVVLLQHQIGDAATCCNFGDSSRRGMLGETGPGGMSRRTFGALVPE